MRMKRVQKRKELSLYIHIPFCEKKCGYCDFLSFTGDNYVKEQYIKALLREIKSYKEFAIDYLVKTVYIGGGTPSSINEKHITEIMDAVKEVFLIQGLDEDKAEITIEINPGTVTRAKLEAYKKASINRLSMGLQSADNEELGLLGRIHTYEQFKDNYYMAKEIGFCNINIDLVSGLPKQSPESFYNTLDKVSKLEPEHISVYSLIIEPGTEFYERYSPGAVLEMDLVSEDIDREIYDNTKKILAENKYRRYEISNYSKTGFESKHNSSYWTGREYLGMGLGASSLIGNTRFHNEDNLIEYVTLSKDYLKLRRDIEPLYPQALMEEFMFLGLRLCKGVTKTEFESRFQTNIDTVFGSALEKLVKEELLVVEGDKIYLTDRGLSLSNYAMGQFLLEDEDTP